MTEDGPATVPATNFTGEGLLLISAMSEGRLEKTARRQEVQGENPDHAEIPHPRRRSSREAQTD